MLDSPIAGDVQGGQTFRLAVVDTNPVQYRVPLWRAIDRDGRIAIKVFYASRLGLEAANVPGFGESWVWDVPLLDGYQHEFLPSVRIPLLPRPGANRFPLSLGRKLREGCFDAVLVLGYVSAPALAGMIAAWRTGTPIVLRGESHEHGSRRTLSKRAKRLLLPFALGRVAAFLAIGEWNREYWLKLGVPVEKIWTAVYSVDNSRFRRRLAENAQRPAELRAKWAAGREDVVFIFSGKLCNVKAPEVLLQAYEVLQQIPAAHLVMVGTGPMERELKAHASRRALERVHWEGFVNQRDLPFYYAAADVLVLPSRFEPWGVVVNEAMACGTPCIVSDVVGAGPDLVAGKDTGLVFRHDDVDGLVEAMQKAMSPEARTHWRSRLEAPLRRAGLAQNVTTLADCLGALRQSNPKPSRSTSGPERVAE